MTELEWQKLIVKAVTARGGFGLKLNNRFLGGIPDLLIKAYGREAELVEVKLDKLTKSKLIRPSLTTLQEKFLRRAWGQTLPGSVLSIVEDPGDRKHFALKKIPIDEWLQVPIHIDNYVWYPKTNREQHLYEHFG